MQGVKVLNKNAQQKISGGVADAIAGAAANGTHWCCDSCGSAIWLNGSSWDFDLQGVTIIQHFNQSFLIVMKHSFLSLQGVKVLNKNAQKKISGGIAQAGTCAYESLDGDIGEDSISKADAIAGAAANGTHWCCDSCHSASWYAGDI